MQSAFACGEALGPGSAWYVWCYRSIESLISWLEGELEAEIESGFWKRLLSHTPSCCSEKMWTRCGPT